MILNKRRKACSLISMLPNHENARTKIGEQCIYLIEFCRQQRKMMIAKAHCQKVDTTKQIYSLQKSFIRVITYLLMPVHSGGNAIKTRAPLTLRVKNDVNTQRQIANPKFKKHIRSFLTNITVMRRMYNDRRVVTKMIGNDFR